MFPTYSAQLKSFQTICPLLREQTFSFYKLSHNGAYRTSVDKSERRMGNSFYPVSYIRRAILGPTRTIYRSSRIIHPCDIGFPIILSLELNSICVSGNVLDTHNIVFLSPTIHLDLCVIIPFEFSTFFNEFPYQSRNFVHSE